MFPFNSLDLVIVSSEISRPREHSSSQTLLSAQKPFGGLCLAGPSIGTLTGWKLLLPSWLASFLQLWLRLKRGAHKRIGSRQILGHLLSSTENVDITSLRGSGSANPFPCALPIGLGALPPLTRLGNRVESALQARFLQSVAKQAAKAAQQTVVLGCAAKPPAFKRISTMACPLPFGLLSGISPRTRRERGPKPAVVLETPQGDIASSSEDLARVWQDTFFREIDRREEIIPKCAYVPFCLSDA